MPPLKKKSLSLDDALNRLSEIESGVSVQDLPPFIQRLSKEKQTQDTSDLGPIKPGAVEEGIQPITKQLIQDVFPESTKTSLFRSIERNRAVGGVPGSKHTTGQAFDVRLGEVTPGQIEQVKKYGFKAIRESDHYHFEQEKNVEKPLSLEDALSKLTDINKKQITEQSINQHSEEPQTEEGFFQRLKKRVSGTTPEQAQMALARGVESIGLPSIRPGESFTENVKRNALSVLFPGAASTYKLSDRPGEAVRAGLSGKNILEQFSGLKPRTSGEEVLQETGIISPELRKQLEQFPERIKQIREEQVAGYPEVVQKAIAPGAALTNILPSQLISKGPGIATEIITDPLTYIGVGQAKQLAKGNKLGGLVSKTDDTTKIAQELKLPTKIDLPDSAVEARFQAAKGIKKPTIISQAKEGLETGWNKLTRQFEHLPAGPEYAEFKFKMNELGRKKEVVEDQVVRNLQEITSGMNDNALDLFTKKVILNDLKGEYNQGRKLAFGLDETNFQKSLDTIDSALTPELAARVQKRREIWDGIRTDYINAMKDAGADVTEKLKNPDYFRHQVLEYAKAKSAISSGKNLKTPTGRGFLKGRSELGSSLDINTDYLQAENEVMAQMLHDTNIAKMIKTVDDNHNIQPRLAEEARLLGKKVNDIIPNGYTEWKPREGSTFYMADSIPARVADQIKEGMFKNMSLPKETVKELLAIGGPRKSFIIPEELAATLNKLPEKTNPLSKLQTGWKQWQLLSPKRVVKYNLRNITGDVDAVIAGNPGTFKEVPSAITDLSKLFRGKMNEISPELRSWYESGGMGSLLQAQEMGDIKSLNRFDKIINAKGLAKIPEKTWQQYWKATRMSTDFREAILRFSAYKNYLKQMRENNGIPKNFGASLREEVMALGDINDRAYKLSNDLLGAYDEVGVTGQWLRKNLMPFWSWKEVNLKRYARLTKNAIQDGKAASQLAQSLVGKAITLPPMISYKIGSFALKAMGLTAAVTAWNNLMYPSEEKDLPVDVKNRPHITLGRNEDGSVRYFDRIGAVMDLGEWFSLDDAPRDIQDYVTGRRTLKEIAKDMVVSPVKVLAGQVGPQYKIPTEMLIGKKFFPDPLNPRPIRDKGLHIAEGLGLGEEYRYMQGLPKKPSKQSLQNVFIYSIDPGEAAYNDMYAIKKDFLEASGKENSADFKPTPKANALYNMKQAIKFKDKAAYMKYFTEYAILSDGDIGSLQKTIDRMNPLYGIKDEDIPLFAKTLTPEQKDTLKKALIWYKENIAESKPPKLESSDIEKIKQGLKERRENKVKRLKGMIQR